MNDLVIGSLHLSPAALEAILAMLAGVLILLVPRILPYVVGIYLLVVGGYGVWRGLNLHFIPFKSIVALAAGILALFNPRWLHILVGVYLILTGLFGVLR